MYLHQDASERDDILPAFFEVDFGLQVVQTAIPSHLSPFHSDKYLVLTPPTSPSFQVTYGTQDTCLCL